MMSTDEVTAVADKLLHVHELVHVATTQPDVGVIVHAPAGDIASVAARAGREGDPRLLRRRLRRALARTRSSRCARCGDELLPEVSGSGPLFAGCARAACCARRRARWGSHHRFYFLRPRGGLSVGQMVLARTDGAIPVKGALRLSATGALPQRPMRAGDVLVVELDGSSASVRGLERIVAWLGSSGLRRRAAGAADALAFHQRQQQRRARQHRRARDQHRQRHAQRDAAERRVRRSARRTARGASATGTIV